MDLAKEVEIVDGLALGDTLLLERGAELVGFAIYHTPGVSEAPGRRGLREVPRHRPPSSARPSTSSSSSARSRIWPRSRGCSRVILPVYLRYWQAYSTLLKCGYQVDLTMVRMQKGKQEDYEDPADLVLDDWR